ncbi:adenosylcobinamide-GDP ribazoletransferase [Pantanalinema sp. GBBB05]|uniref:adenosylcobinamide-GDP ribazoletransferase n=1 Tax=Pantanalinema sp. GBBB05 TaxID=2604139 RepID=UPI001DB51B2C|nr:adenosylcobinamide-GDP ribazoletransferase [Pantanalinema sp. GBBB05]
MTDDSAPKFHLLRAAKTALGAIAFYTCLPIPHHWSLNFQGIARWATAVGLLIGGLLGLLDLGLQYLTMPVLVRSAVIVGVWLALTGGLHLDGAMDTADGLAVLDPQRRLEVMADSRTGAFGVMAAVIILLLKVTALTSLEADREIALIAATGWGRWGQLVAIVRYPYLKPTGKGAFHKPAIRSSWDILPSTGLLLGLSGLVCYLQPNHWRLIVGITLGGASLALVTGAWFHHQLGGHTGDTYGAVVEWTEAFLLCGLTMLV